MGFNSVIQTIIFLPGKAQFNFVLCATCLFLFRQILWKNNIVIGETSGEIGDDLPKIRYRNGIPGNNRTMVRKIYLTLVKYDIS